MGEGAYGVVYKALDTVLDKHVALKKIKLETEEEGIPTTALREMTLLRHLDHPNVVKLENVIMDPGRLYLVFELVDTDLKKLMDSADGPFSPDLVQVRFFSTFIFFSYPLSNSNTFPKITLVIYGTAAGGNRTLSSFGHHASRSQTTEHFNVFRWGA